MSEGVSPSPKGTRRGFSVHTHNLIGGLIVAVLALALLGYAFYVPNTGHAAPYGGSYSFGRSRRSLWFLAGPWSAGFLWRLGPRHADDAGLDRFRRVAWAARFCLRSRHGAAAVLVCPCRPRRRGCDRWRLCRRAADRKIQNSRSGARHYRDSRLRRHDPPDGTGARNISGVHDLDPGIDGDAVDRKPDRGGSNDAFCVLLFVYLLNLPFQLWPRFS